MFTANELGSTLKAKLNPRNFSFRMWIGVITLVVLAVLPLGMTMSQLSVLTGSLFLMMFAMSWDAVSGYTGQISFGHTFFFGLGGYTSMVLNLQHGFSPILGLVVGTLIAGIGGIIIGVPALRVKGPYLALMTLIAPMILLALIVGFRDEIPYIAPKGLGGSQGLITPNDPLVGTAQNAVITVDDFALSILVEYYVVFAIMALIMFACLAVTGLEAGEIFTAIREDENAVSSAGISPAKFKIFAFVFSGMVGGLAGAAFVHTTAGNPINPQNFVALDAAIEIIIMAVLGGMGTIVGPVVGAALFGIIELLVEMANVTIPVWGVTLDSTMPAPMYLLAIVVLMLRPDGLVGWMEDLYRRYQGDEEPRPDEETGNPQFIQDIIARFRP